MRAWRLARAVAALSLPLALASACAPGSHPWPPFQDSLGVGDPITEFTSLGEVEAVLPENLGVTPPDATVPPEAAHLSGAWTGWQCFNRTTDLKIVFTSVRAADATAVIARGSQKWSGVVIRTFRRFGNELYYEEDGFSYKFRLRPTGVLDFLYAGPGGMAWCSGVLRKSDDILPRSADAPGSDCPTGLHRNARITAPAEDLPNTLKRWSGFYGGGRWDTGLCHSVAVLTVNKDGSAVVQYAWGPAPPWESRPGYRTYEAKIDGDKLRFTIEATGAIVTYVITGDKLNGTWKRADRIYQTTLTRVQ